jgi:hypothetical protein
MVETSEPNTSANEQTIPEVSPSTRPTKSPAPADNRKPTFNKRKRNPVAAEAYDVMKKLGTNLKQKDDCDIFGENVACQLRDIRDVRSRMIAKHRINEVLFEIGMSQFQIPSPSNASSGDQEQVLPIGNGLSIVNNTLEVINEGETEIYTVLNVE